MPVSWRLTARLTERGGMSSWYYIGFVFVSSKKVIKWKIIITKFRDDGISLKKGYVSFAYKFKIRHYIISRKF